jgi:Lsr2
MSWRSPLGYRTWTCGCGRHSLADALDTCPGCGAPKDRGEPAGGGPAEAAKPSDADVRAWAASRDIRVAPKGKISKAVYEQYAAAHEGG